MRRGGRERNGLDEVGGGGVVKWSTVDFERTASRPRGEWRCSTSTSPRVWPNSYQSLDTFFLFFLFF